MNPKTFEQLDKIKPQKNKQTPLCPERKAAVAGIYYPSSKEDLSRELTYLMDESKKPFMEETLKALIVPHNKLELSGIVAGAAYNLFRQQLTKKINPTKIVVLGAPHTIAFNGTALDNSDYWSTPLGKVKIRKINGEKLTFVIKLGEAHQKDHSVEMQLIFLQEIFEKQKKEFELIPIITGLNDFEAVKSNLKYFLEKENAFLIISSDLCVSDYDDVIRTDTESKKSILRLEDDRLKEVLQACNKPGIIALTMLAKELGWKPRLLDYKVSENETSVGYASIAYY